MQSFVILCRSSSVYLAGPVASSVLGVGVSSAGLEVSSAWGDLVGPCRTFLRGRELEDIVCGVQEQMAPLAKLPPNGLADP